VVGWSRLLVPHGRARRGLGLGNMRQTCGRGRRPRPEGITVIISTITKEMCVIGCLSRMHARTVDTTTMEEDAPVCDRFPAGTLGRCSNTQLMAALLF
jgi:hypothetical protein